jgi:hypothetical protein
LSESGCSLCGTAFAINSIIARGFSEMEVAKSNLASMSVDALLELRDDIGKVLSRRAGQLRDQLSRLGKRDQAERASQAY